MMLGAGQTVGEGRTIDFDYLRLELGDDGSVKYVIVPNRQPEIGYRLSSTAKDEFTFSNPSVEFPQRIVYHRGDEGWLYARVEGKVNGVAKEVTYPMRHVDCMSGEVLRK